MNSGLTEPAAQVGVSVTNALATRLQVMVWRDGQVATLGFAGGNVVEPLVLRKAGAGERRHGTRVTVLPDVKCFDSVELPRADLIHLLRSKAVPGATVSLTQDRKGDKLVETQTWLYQGGLRDYLKQGLQADPLIPLFEGAAWCMARNEEGVQGELLGMID